MMPPQNRPPLPPMQATPATPEPVFPAARIDDILRAHADYNLQPLVVHSLDHYVTVDDEVKRFYVR